MDVIEEIMGFDWGRDEDGAVCVRIGATENLDEQAGCLRSSLWKKQLRLVYMYRSTH